MAIYLASLRLQWQDPRKNMVWWSPVVIPLHPWYSCHTFLYLSYSQACQHITTLSKYLHCAVPRDLLPQIRGVNHYGCYYKMERSNLSTNEPGKRCTTCHFCPYVIYVHPMFNLNKRWRHVRRQLDHDCMSVASDLNISQAPGRQIYHTLSDTWELTSLQTISFPHPQPHSHHTAQTKRRCLRHVRLGVPELFDAIRR